MKNEFITAITAARGGEEPAEGRGLRGGRGRAGVGVQEGQPRAVERRREDQPGGRRRCSVFTHEDRRRGGRGRQDRDDGRRRRAQFKPDAKIGDVLEFEATPANAGRIAAQTAKQVVLQRLREAEREVVYEEYSGKEGDIVSGVVQRLEGRNVIIDLGKTEAVLPPPEQVRTEHYRAGQRAEGAAARGVQGGEGAAGRRLADAQGPAAAAVRAGGAGDLQGHRRDQVDRARGGIPLEGGGVLAAGGRRPGRARASACAASASRTS